MYLIRDYFPNRLDEDTDESYNNRMKWLKSYACRKELDDKLAFEKAEEEKWVRKDKRFKEELSVEFVLQDEYDKVQFYNRHHFEMLTKLSKESAEHVDKFNHPDIYKNITLFSLSKNAKHILQVGFRSGHETLNFLISNPLSKIHCFDLCKYSFTKLSIQYLQLHFPGRLVLHEGDSLHEMPKFREQNKETDKILFDVAYLASTKALDISNGNFFETVPLIHYKSFLIFDNPFIQYLWDGYVNNKDIKEVKNKLPTNLFVGYFLEGPEVN